MEEQNFFAGLPQKVRYYLLTKFLDGPSACALMQSTRYMSLNLPLSCHQERWLLRLKPKTYETYYGNNAFQCVFCKKVYKESTKHHCVQLDLYTRNNINPSYYLASKCDKCGECGIVRGLYPWLINPNIYVSCYVCNRQVKRPGFDGCLVCGVKCDYCKGSMVQCAKCKEDVLTTELSLHLRESCTETSKSRKLWSFFGYKYCPDCHKSYVDAKNHFYYYHSQCHKCKQKFITQTALKEHHECASKI